jgi:hypothetical protein
MATVALTTTPTQIDDGTSYTVLVTNTGAVEVDLSRGGRLRPQQSRTVYPEGAALTAAATSGTGTVTTSTTSKPLPNAADPASLAANAAFTGTYAVIDQAGRRALRGILDTGSGDAVVGIFGDSTGDGSVEWAHKWAELLATQYPDLRVEYNIWNDTSQAYDATEVLQAGGSAARTVISDNFNRTASELVGTFPSTTGNLAWIAQATAWTLNGSAIARANDTALGETAVRGGLTGNMTATFGGVTINTNGGAGQRDIRFIIKYLDTQNYLYFHIGATNGGSRQWDLNQRIANTVTQLAVGATNPTTLPASTAAAAIGSVVVSLTGLTFTATINGTDTLTTTVSQATADALALADGIGIRADVQSGMLVDSVTLAVTPTTEATRKVVFWNGSMAGSDLTYQTSRLNGGILPVAPTLLMLSSSHNYAVEPTVYAQNLKTAVAAVNAKYANTPIVLMSQNPRKLPASQGSIDQHARRNGAMPQIARQNMWDYIPIFGAWRSRPDRGYQYINPDGIHPSADGSLLNRDTVSTWFLNTL